MNNKERKRKTLILTIITIIILIIILLINLSCSKDSGIFYEDLYSYLSRNDYKELDVEESFLKDTDLFDENFICETIKYENNILTFYDCEVTEGKKTTFNEYCTYDGKDFVCEEEEIEEDNKEELEDEKNQEDNTEVEEETTLPSTDTKEEVKGNNNSNNIPPSTTGTTDQNEEKPEEPEIPVSNIVFNYSETAITKNDVEVEVTANHDLLYCISSSNNCTPKDNLTSKLNLETEGVHYVCVQDKKTLDIKCSTPIIIDKTAPVINEPTIVGTLGNNGWYKTHVVVQSGGALDNLSGIKEIDIDYPIINYNTTSKEVTITATDNAGNTSTKKINIKVDTTMPVINYTVNGTVGLNNYYTTDVTVENENATDTYSGLASLTINKDTFNEDTAGEDIIITAVDNAGNTTVERRTIKIDKTEPSVISYDITEKNIGTDWHNQIVVIDNFQVEDLISGVNQSIIDSLEYTVTNETSGQYVEVRITDLAGNTHTERINVKIDLTPPTAGVIGATKPPNASGWYNEDVNITSTSGSDNLSGVKSNELSMTIVNGELLETTVYLTTTDNAGHTSQSDLDVKIDKVIPEVGTVVADRPPDHNGWYNAPVGIGKIDGSDSGSGHVSTTVSLLELNESTVSTRVQITTTDIAGNVAQAYSEEFKVDLVTPTITQNENIKIEHGTNVDLTTKFTSTFGVSNGSTTCSVTNTSPLAPGTYNLSCTATSNAGLSNTINTTFEVVNRYDVLEYIGSDGDQYINTGLYNTGDYIFEDEFLITNLPIDTGDGSWIVGGRVNPNYSMGVFVNRGQVIAAYGATTKIMYPGIAEDVWYKMYFSRFKLTLNTTNYTVNGQLLIPEMYKGEVVVGGNQVAYDGVSKDTRNMQGKRKYFKITDATTGELVRHYIPVELSDGTIGMWELIEDKFYGNDGTGSFTKPTP